MSKVQVLPKRPKSGERLYGGLRRLFAYILKTAGLPNCSFLRASLRGVSPIRANTRICVIRGAPSMAKALRAPQRSVLVCFVNKLIPSSAAANSPYADRPPTLEGVSERCLHAGVSIPNRRWKHVDRIFPVLIGPWCITVPVRAAKMEAPAEEHMEETK